MKVLQVYKDYFPPVRGGIEGHINLLANGLKENGVGVEVLVSNTSSRLEKENIDGIPVTKVPQIGRYVSASLNLNFSYWINKLGEQADILHFHFPNPTAEISYLISGLNKKVIITYHSDIIRQARLLKLYSPLLKQFLKKADDIIITSPNYLETSPYLADFKSKCTLVPFGINLSEFDSCILNNNEIESIRYQHGASIILFIGRFRYYKGLHVLIESMKSIEGKLLLIGGGPLEADLKKQVDKLNLNNRISFLGELTDSEKINYLHACDVFVLPSIYRSEAFGIVLLEAMACSKPVVCTELGTGTSFVNQQQKTGLVVKPNDPVSLSQSINHILRNPDIKERYGKTGYERVRDYFSRERMVNEVLAVYERNLSTPAISLPAVTVADFEVQPRKIKVLRIISRLNIGGPAIHAFLLTKNLDADKFETLLVTGSLSNTEGDMSFLFDSLEKKPIYIDALQRELNPVKDLIAFIEILKILYKNKPDIVHTHTTKAGASTRFAVFLYGLLTQRKIKTIHTFHGHVLHGYFGTLKTRVFIRIERILAKFTERIVVICPLQYHELCHQFKIAPPNKFSIIPLGFDLTQFLDAEAHRGELRKELHIPEDMLLVGMVGRLTAIKNHALFLRSAARVLEKTANVRFLIIGDGELAVDLKQLADDLQIKDRVIFLGWRDDMASVYAGLDLVVLTSFNEGTPVTLIEAMASAKPVVATAVGGVPDIVLDGQTGILAPSGDADGLAVAMTDLLLDPGKRQEFGERGREFVREKYTKERLCADIEKLYGELLSARAK